MEFDIFDKDFEDKINRYVGEKIKYYRQKRKLSQKDLGEKVGVGDKAISKYELGNSSITSSMIFKIAKVLEVNVNDLFPDIDVQGTDSNSELIDEIKTWDKEEQDALLNFARIFKKDS